MTIIGALPFLLQNGTTADATQVDADFDAVVNDVNTNAAHNGTNTDITALNGLTVPITPAQGGSNVWVDPLNTSTGSANAQIIASPVPAGFSLTQGNRIAFLAAFTNTGPMTLNVNGTGATAVFRQTPLGPIACTGGEVVANNTIEAIVDVFGFVLLENGAGISIGPYTALASASNTDLGSIPSHNISLTGTATITTFGSSANLAYPIYNIYFAGVMTITYNSGILVLPGAANIVTAAGDTAVMLYGGLGSWIMASYTRANGQALVFSATYLQNYIAGLTLSTAGGSGTFGVAAGEATDSTSQRAMLLASAYTKTTSSWAVGSGFGGLDTGAIANATWYHVFLITRTDTGVTDILFSLSPTAPTLPTSYNLFRRIGAMRTDGSAHWLAFTQTGGTFTWAAPVTDVNAIASTASRVSTVLTVPTGVVVTALFRAGQNIGAGASAAIIFTSLQENDQAPTFGAFCDMSNIQNTFTGGSFERLTNTSAQIGVRSANTVATITVSTFGWKDLRGT